MTDDDTSSRLGSFLLGGLIGGLAGFAASRLGASRARPPAGSEASDLRPFEAAPCFAELAEPDSEPAEPDS
jgi:hypothetical protein